MRFQDAAPDARAIVYAGIQADPLVARAAAVLANAGHAERVLARAVMNGESTDPGAWNDSGRHRLVVLVGRADRILSNHDRPHGWTLRRRSAAAR